MTCRCRVINAPIFLVLVGCLFAVFAASQSSGYMQNLKDLSFDMGLMREYPSEWSTTGVAIPIMSKVKVVPEIPNVNGQIFMKNELVTAAWDVAFRMEIDMSEKLDKLKINEM